jgi:hypothetical protein
MKLRGFGAPPSTVLSKNCYPWDCCFFRIIVPARVVGLVVRWWWRQAPINVKPGRFTTDCAITAEASQTTRSGHADIQGKRRA